MADISAALKNWSSTPSSNNPTSATTIGSGLAPNFQQIQATLRNELGARSASMASGATVDIGTKDEGVVLITHASGTTSITSLGTVSSGIKKLVTLVVTSGALTLTHNATSLILPSSANITVATGDSFLAESLGSGNWKVHAYYKQDGNPVVSFNGGTVNNPTTFNNTTTFNQDSTMVAATDKWAKGADVASATALPLITGGNYFDVTGTTTITSFNSVGVGTWIRLHFDAALTLTHNATDLILPGGLNILTAIGDEAEFIEYASGDYRCVSYTRASGRSLIGSKVQMPPIVTTSGTSWTFSSIPSWASEINVFFKDFSTNGTNNYYIQIGDSGGVESAGYDSLVSEVGNAAATATGGSTAAFLLTLTTAAATSFSGLFTLRIADPATNLWTLSGNGFSGTVMRIAAGTKALSGTLDRVLISTNGVVNTGDAGSIALSYS